MRKKVSQNLRNISTLALGTIIAQAIAFGAQMYLRRVIPVEDFGAFGVYLSVVGILSGIAMFRYEMAIILPEKDKDAGDLLSATLFISLLFSIFILLFFLCFKSFSLNLLSLDEKYYPWLLFAPFSIFFASSYKSINNWLIRKKAFKNTSSNKIIRRASEVTAQIASIPVKFSYLLPFGELTGNFMNFIIGFKQIFARNFYFQWSLKVQIKILKRYIHFPKYNSLPFLMNRIALFIPPIIINILYSEQITGFFDLTKQTLGAGFAILSVSISQVFIQQIAEKRNSGQKIYKDIVRTAVILSLLSLIAVIPIFFFGEEIFSLLFGIQNKFAGRLSEIMIFIFAIQLIASPLSVIFINLEKLKLFALWQTFYVLVILSLLLVRNMSIIHFIYLYTAYIVVVYGLLLVLILRTAKQYDLTLDKLK